MRRLVALAVLTLAFPVAAELRLELVRHSLTGTHCRYREYVGGIPTESYVTKPCSASFDARLTVDAPRGDRIRLGDRVVRRIVVNENPLEPFGYDYDVETGALVRRVPLFFRGKPALVFAPNPVVTLNDPTLQDHGDAAEAVPMAGYSAVELLDVEPAGALRGPHVTSVDRQSPSIAPPAAEASLIFNREQDGFEYVNAYHHIDASQRHLEALGYTGSRQVVPYAIEVDAHGAGGSDNSFFLPSNTRPGVGTLYFGDGGTDDAEDADLVVHEYAHAILEWVAPGTFAGAFTSQPRALAEGFGDYWAYSAHVDERLASGRDPFCFADWDARCWEDAASENCGYPPGSDCLRRLDSTKTMADYDPVEAAGVEHRNGAIWSSALREIHQHFGRAVTDTIVIESLFGTPPEPTFALMGQRMMAADQLLFGGVHRDVICAAMTARDIVTACSTAPRGERTLFQSFDGSLAIPDNSDAGVVSTLTIDDPRVIEKLYVTVDIAHASRGDLRLELVAPDGTRVVLHDASFERRADLRGTFGVDLNAANSLDVFRGRSAAGTWQLVVRDLRVLDTGTLRSWGLVIQFAGDEPQTMRPRADRAQMIPVVAHVYGVGLTPFSSDVRLANVGSSSQTATMVFTPSGADGTTDFYAVDVVVAPGQTVAFDDVVATAFTATGSGSLEILGDVIAMSRTYAMSNGGTMGQQVPPVADTASQGSGPLYVFPMNVPGVRTNLGFVETSGKPASVRTAGSGSPRTYVPPFGHVQYPWTFERRLDVFGEGRVAAYVSQVDEVTGDAMFIPAALRPPVERTVIAPVISAEGVGASEWRSDVWISLFGTSAMVFEAIGAQQLTVPVQVESERLFVDVLAEVFHRSMTLATLRTTLPPYGLGGTRIRNGRMSQYVPFETPDGPELQELVFIDSNEAYRTNIGIATEAPAWAEVSVYDARGMMVESHVLSTAGGVAQVPVTTSGIRGRASVRFVSGRGRAYASLVDNRTGDATYIAGQ